ncbi:MAG: hypothetical protein F9K18_08925, partial [Thermoanaerobaculia bacterium]
MDERDGLDARLAELTGFDSVDASRCPDEARWVDLARGTLPAAQVERLRDHLSSCPRCVEAARDARRFLAALGELEERPAASARKRRIALIAATLLAAAGLALVLEQRRDAPDPLARWASGALAAPNPLPGSVDDELVFRGDSDGPPTRGGTARLRTPRSPPRRAGTSRSPACAPGTGRRRRRHWHPCADSLDRERR